jgi:PAS domain S-box-containing protein
MYRRDSHPTHTLDASLFRRFFDHSPLFMMISERTTGRYCEVNESFTRLFGYSRDEVLGRSSVELGILTAEERARFDASTTPEGPIDGVEVTVRKKDGTYVLCRCWIEVTAGLLLIAGEEITERRRVEASSAQSDRLSSLGQLAAGIAHEVNNPLAYVVGNLEAAVDDLLALEERLGGSTERELFGELTTNLSLALEGSRRIGRISRTLGAFSRVDRDVREAVDLNAAIESAATLAQSELRFRARLELALGQVPKVAGSEGKAGQVFLNLLISAAHALPEGQGGMHLITVRSRQEGDEVVVEVEHSGPSVSRAEVSRLFEPFVDARATGAGAGLSLAITKTIVTGFGGSITAEPRPGQGTRFVVRWPVFRAATPEVAPPAPSAPSGLIKGRVLVADDEDAIRRTLVRLLGRDHDVVAAASGLEARQLLERDGAFDLILCDLMMPGLTGMELHAWLVETRPALAERLVFLSGGAFTPQAIDYLAQVTNLRLEKPFDPPALRGLVRDRVAAVRRA